MFCYHCFAHASASDELGKITMRFGSSRSQLYDAQKVAQAQWDEVTQWWQDSTRHEHEDKVWQPFDEGATKTLRAIDQLTSLFHEVRVQCEFNNE